jgi:hypothetical protein
MTSKADPDAAGLAADAGDGSAVELVCTIEGGPDAIRARAGEWAAVTALARRREQVGDDVTLIYDPDPAVAVELTRLAAAEVACCSFFTFALEIGTPGVRFTVSAPPEAAELVAALVAPPTGGGPTDGGPTDGAPSDVPPLVTFRARPGPDGSEAGPDDGRAGAVGR